MTEREDEVRTRSQERDGATGRKAAPAKGAERSETAVSERMAEGMGLTSDLLQPLLP